MAVDVSLSRAHALPRTAVLPARLALAGVVGISFTIRFAAALIHTTPLYFSDEYIYATPLGIAAGLRPTRLLGYYSGVADLGVKPVALGHWLGTDALLLASAAGFALVPGALAGLVAALARPRFRDEGALAALGLGVLLAIFAEATLYATNRSDRFQERYLMVLLPLVFPAFWIWVRARAARRPGGRRRVAGADRARRARAALRLHDQRLEAGLAVPARGLPAGKAIGIGNGSLVVVVCASVLAGLAIAVCFRPVFARVAVIATLLAAGAASFGAVAFDSHVVRAVRTSLVAADARWIDHSGLRNVTLVETPATPHAAAHEQLFWNDSLKRIYFLDAASAIDAFGWPRLHAAPDGRLVSGSKTLRGPLLISQYAVRTQLAGAVQVARAASFSLWRPTGTPRFALFTGGLYQDGWLSQSGHVTVYPAKDGWVRGVLHFPVLLPPKPQSERTVLQLSGPGTESRAVVLPGHDTELTFRVNHRGPWTLSLPHEPPGLPDRRPPGQRDGEDADLHRDLRSERPRGLQRFKRQVTVCYKGGFDATRRAVRMKLTARASWRRSKGRRSRASPAGGSRRQEHGLSSHSRRHVRHRELSKRLERRGSRGNQGFPRGVTRSL